MSNYEIIIEIRKEQEDGTMKTLDCVIFERSSLKSTIQRLTEIAENNIE